MFRRALVVILCLFISLPAFSLWKTLKTEAFTVFYPKGREREAEEILEVLEYYRSYAGDLVGARTRRVAVVLEDIGMESNGLTDATFHRILLFRSSPSDGALAYYQNWWRLVGVHEYTHWRHLSAAEGLPAVLTAVFGIPLAPGNYTPGWLKEGICVVAESGTSAYEGRLNEGLFDAYATVLAKTGNLPTIVQATYNLDDFPGATGLRLFGGQFVEFLVHKFGREQVSRFFVHYSASILSYLSPALPAAGLDRSARKVFGESIRSLWLEWQLELMKRSVSVRPPEVALTAHGWWLHSPVFSNGQLYYQRSFTVKPAPFSTYGRYQLMHLDPKSGLGLVLLRSSAPFSGPMRVRSNRLYYALQEIEGGYDNHFNNRYGYTAVLYSMAPGAEGQSRSIHRLFKEPFRTFEVLVDGMILTAVDRREAFGSEIWLHDPVSGTAAPVLRTDLLISDIVADSRNIFVAARADWDNTQIFRVSVPNWSGGGSSLSGVNPADIGLEPLHDTPFQEAELCLTEDSLFYSATYGAKRTLYEYELDTGVVYRAVSSDFARSPAWDADSRSLCYIGLNAQGEDLYREKALTREITVPNDAMMQGAGVAGGGNRGERAGGVPAAGVPAAADLDIPDAAIRRGGYWDNLATLLPRTLFPVELGFFYPPMNFRVGAGIAGTSALGDFQYIVLGFFDSFYMRSEIEATLQTNILAPLIATFDLGAAADSQSAQLVELALTLDLPLYQSLGTGFSYFALGTMGILGLQPPTLIPYTVLGFQGAASQAFLQIAVECLDGVGDFACLLLPGLDASVVFLGAELSLQASGLFDLSDDTWYFPQAWVPPGYDSLPASSWAGAVFATLSMPLLRLRGGLWNPGLYIGDVFIAPFSSMAFNDQGLQLSYGATLRLEIKTGARDEGFPWELGAGFGMTLERESFLILPYFRIGGYGTGYGGGYADNRPGNRPPQPVLRQ